MKHMKNLYRFLLAGLILTTACQQFSEEVPLPRQEQVQRIAFIQHIQGIAQTLNSFSPSEQVFLKELHQSYPSLDQFFREAKEEEIHQLRKTLRNKILDEILIPIEAYTSLLIRSVKTGQTEESFPSYQTDLLEEFPAWSCKELCVIRAERSRLANINTCLSEKGDEHECREEADIRYFYFLTDCTANC